MRKRFLVCSAQGFGETFWQPPADIYRTHKGWLIKMDLAGVLLDDIKVSSHENCLTVQGIRRDLIQEENCNFYSLEISYSQFKRTITLPVVVEELKQHLDYKDGMLFIVIENEE
jgi:HSP20 family molecular chaperone IbpA